MVLDTGSNDLQRAQRRAYVHSLTAKCVHREQRGFDGSEFFDVASFSQRGQFHRVRLDYTAEGIDATCDCLAGQNGLVCQHIAAALDAANSLPVEAPTPAPALTTAWFRARLRGED